MSILFVVLFVSKTDHVASEATQQIEADRSRHLFCLIPDSSVEMYYVSGLLHCRLFITTLCAFIDGL